MAAALSVLALPAPQLPVSGGIGLLGVPKRGVDVGVAEALADGGEADADVDQGLGVGVPKVVQRPGQVRSVEVAGEPSRTDW